MPYLGDPSLAPDIQSRVLTTFDQTAKLASAGRRQEALLGCDFILRLDPLFTPAKRLQERLDSNDGPIDGAELLADPAEPQPEVLKTVRLSAEELEKMMGESEPADADLIEHGSHAESSSWAGSGAPLESDDGGRSEATSFLAGARRALDSGEIEAARRLLHMAGSLDPTSPELMDLRAELDSITAAPAESAGGDRITQLLAEGQRAFDAERYQDAIDCWSRIFLIEIDHDEASRRIQLARDLREEQDRQVEETFHQGVIAADNGRREAAIAAFRRVLALRPNHLAARDHLDELAAAASGESTVPAATAYAGAAVDGEPAVVPADLQASVEGLARHADPTYRRAARAKRKPVNPLFLVGAAVLVVVAAGAWLLWENWGNLFPNATEETAPAPSRLKEITAMHDAGDLEGAIAALEQLGTDSPEYIQARRLLVRWREELAARSTETQEPLTGDDATRHSTLVAEARQAYDGRNYLQAAKLFTRASAMAPLPAAEAALFEDSKRQLEPIAQQIDLYTQRQWELVLPALWRRFEQSPEDRDVHQLLVNTYFNLTVRELRRASLKKAAEYVAEASRLEHDDADLRRLEQFVATYSAQPRDLLFEIYVQNLDFRR